MPNTLFKATNQEGKIVRDRMTEQELHLFLAQNDKLSNIEHNDKEHTFSSERYTYEAYAVETFLDKIKSFMQTALIVILFLALGFAILEGLMQVI